MKIRGFAIAAVCLAAGGIAAGEQEPVCPWDCGEPANKGVDVVDFLALLAQWGQAGTTCDFDGGGVGVTDFLTLLAHWGPCPAPTNDECATAAPISVAGIGVLDVPFDLYAASAGPEPYACIGDEPTHKDAWYCLGNDGADDLAVRLWTNLELLIEVTAGCTCPPGPQVACGAGPTGTDQFDLPAGAQVLVRLVNHNDLPNAELKGTLSVETETPGAEPVNFYEDLVEFELAAADLGMDVVGEWSFKPDYLPDFGSAIVADPLDVTTHVTNAPGVWWNGQTDLWPPEIDDVQFTSNTTPGPDQPLTPRGPAGLFYAKPGVVPELTNNALLANSFTDSFDIVSGPPGGDNHTGLGLQLIALDIDGVPQTVDIRVIVFDKNDLVMGEHVVTAVQGEKPFLGILTKDLLSTIGRVDITDLSGFAEGISAFTLLGPAACDDCADGNVDECGGNPLCHECLTPDDICLCVVATPCDEVVACPDQVCPPGFLCCSNTCCGEPVCVAICGGAATTSVRDAAPGTLRTDGTVVGAP
jgi:hypothetical protein